MRRAALSLSPKEEHELAELSTRSDLSPNHLRRVRVVELSVQGVAGVEIARRLGISVGQVSRIRSRFILQGASGLADKPHAGRKDHAVPRETVLRILSLATSTPPPGRTRWSTRLIAAHVGLTSATVAKVLRRQRSSDAESVHNVAQDENRLSSPTVASPPPCSMISIDATRSLSLGCGRNVVTSVRPSDKRP